MSQGQARTTKAGDPGLRTALFMAADLARHHDPILPRNTGGLVVDRKLHHNSAILLPRCRTRPLDSCAHMLKATIHGSRGDPPHHAD